MIRGDATETQQIEAIMQVHGVDEAKARFIYAVETRAIRGDVVPEETDERALKRAGLGRQIDEEDE